MEKYDLMNNLAQASAGITFGQIDRGEVDNVRKDLEKVLTGRMKNSSFNVVGEVEYIPPSRHQLSCLLCTLNPYMPDWIREPYRTLCRKNLLRS